MVTEKIMHGLFVIARILVSAYLGLMAMVFIFQNRLIYFPLAEIGATPQSINLPYESISFETDDGEKIHGWFIPADKAKGVLLFCHGNGGNISHRLDSIRIFNRLGLSVLIFDYRGYGQSTGKPTEKGTYLDAEAAWRYLVQNRGVAPAEIIIFGRSLGGSIAAHLAKDHTPGAIILESSFTSIRDMAKTLYPYLPVSFLLRFHYPTREYLQQVQCPVFIIHSRDDDLIPFRQGRQLFDVAREPKEFLELVGNHNQGFLISGERYKKGLDAFISRYGKSVP